MDMKIKFDNDINLGSTLWCIYQRQLIIFLMFLYGFQQFITIYVNVKFKLN
jgi:hypothetical protein